MSNLSLYIATVLIWGSTWLAIKFQLGSVPPTVSVVWRFALAAAMLLGYALWKRLPLRFSLRQHVWIAVQGMFLFGINYVGVYLAEQRLASGLVAVLFSLIVFLNILGMRLFFGAPVKPVGLVGALLGVAGVLLLFWPDVAKFSGAGAALAGVAIGVAATCCASLGNMAASYNQRQKLPILQANGWAMLYGALFVAIFALFAGQRFVFDWSPSYIVSLLYLALFGSVLAFGAYLTLMSRIGVNRAGYSAVLVPLVALLLSTLFEGLRWQASMFVGVALCLGGNLLVHGRAGSRR